MGLLRKSGVELKLLLLFFLQREELEIWSSHEVTNIVNGLQNP